MKHILRKVVLVPRPVQIRNQPTYRIMDMYGPTAGPYLSCFDEENIPPYPVVGMVVRMQGYEKLCRVLIVDEEREENEQVNVEEMYRFPRTDVYCDDVRDHDTWWSPISIIRSIPKGRWDHTTNPPQFHEEITDEHLPQEWDANVPDESEETTQVATTSGATEVGRRTVGARAGGR